MNHAAKMGFVEQAKSELRQRIAQANDLCDQLKKSYSGYSSNIKQILLLVVYILAISPFVWAALNVDMIFKIFPPKIDAIFEIFPSHDYIRDSLLVNAVSLGMCFYISIYTYKIIIHILRIARIDSHVFQIRSIEKRLQTNLNNINNVAADAEKRIFGNANEKLSSKYDVDTEIAKYSGILKTYSNPENKTINILLPIVRWLSTVFFTVIFLYISTFSVSETICDLVKGNITLKILIPYNDLVVFIYIAACLALFAVFHVLFIKNTIRRKRLLWVIFKIFFGGITGGLFFAFLTKIFDGNIVDPSDSTLLNKVGITLGILLFIISVCRGGGSTGCIWGCGGYLGGMLLVCILGALFPVIPFMASVGIGAALGVLVTYGISK